ncbi:TIGR02530 family flagellar biosynthesis protein [Aneurinibacillus uraniidurans]|uniref:TIGR02530 family flagellar biosynthesis protein n=1 Tax=Aneurinibacillus uraniidurans TaxID=2966586 RepID=UPI00234B925D|nr:TIGR02530 family flagellar biosynthesis protein [Aneurinibacillus sp. B1]WCN39098.1 hypothetical protein PO771_06810 [Aneurinibacillus sp. B1]
MNHIKAGQIFYPQPQPAVKPVPSTRKGVSFDSILSQKIKDQQPIEFSNHAIQRLEKRGIELSEEDLNRLSSAVQKVKAKGANESLILMNDVAYIVSVPNQKVITAMDRSSMGENVFTNIDSAVIV